MSCLSKFCFNNSFVILVPNLMLQMRILFSGTHSQLTHERGNEFSNNIFNVCNHFRAWFIVKRAKETSYWRLFTFCVERKYFQQMCNWQKNSCTFRAWLKQFFHGGNKRISKRGKKKDSFALQMTFYKNKNTILNENALLTEWKEEKITSLNDELKNFFYFTFDMRSSNWKEYNIRWKQ